MFAVRVPEPSRSSVAPTPCTVMSPLPSSTRSAVSGSGSEFVRPRSMSALAAAAANQPSLALMDLRLRVETVLLVVMMK